MDNILDNTSVYTETDLIRYYFNRSPRLSYEEISFVITTHHNIPMTIDRLKKSVHKLGLRRRGNLVDDGVLDTIIRNEVTTSMSLVGYRQMAHVIARKYGINIPQERVRRSLLRIDPEGVEFRSRNVVRRRIYCSRGPFHIVHIDGHDKLKKWGFAIHGGIDGFSRRILWLKVSTTNNDPLVVANFFLEFPKKYKTAPNILRFDRGRENIYCEDMRHLQPTVSEVSYMAHQSETSALKHYGPDLFVTVYAGGWIYFRRWVWMGFTVESYLFIVNLFCSVSCLLYNTN